MIRMACLGLFFSVAGSAAPGAADAERAVVLRLKSGHEVSGRILPEGFDEAVGIILRRDDNGGKLRLRWDQIHPDDVDAVKRMYGFVGDDLPAVLIDALEIETSTGQKVVGINRGIREGKLWLQRGESMIPVPTGSIKKQRTVKVEALEIADPMEVYIQRQQEVQPSEAVDWFNLGLYAESLTLFDQAEACYDRALELDPNFSKKDLIERKKQELAIKREEKEATADLVRIQSMMVRGRYDDALAACDEFLADWPSSRQMGALQKLKQEIVERRHDSLVRRCRTDYFTFLRDIVKQKIRERDLELADAVRWTGKELEGLVFERLATYYKADEDEVRQVWSERGLEGSPQTFSYNGGTFTLGEERAKRDLVKGFESDKESEEGEGGGGVTSQPKTLEDIIEEKLKEKQAAREKAKNKKEVEAQQIYDVPPTPDEWWMAATPEERRMYLLAWYAEQERKLEVTRVAGRACSTCSGKGKLEYWGENKASGEQNKQARNWEPCPRCKGLGFDRVISVK